MQIPANVAHEVEVLEDTLVDRRVQPGPPGLDRQDGQLFQTIGARGLGTGGWGWSDEAGTSFMTARSSDRRRGVVDARPARPPASRLHPPTHRSSSRTTGAPGPARPTNTTRYIKNTAEAIDESARRAGVFEEVRTVTPAPGTVADWTHLRIFRLKNAAAETGARRRPRRGDAAGRARRGQAQSEQRSGQRGCCDLVRREVWTSLR